MTHLRQQIRERIAATITGLPTSGSNVFDTRIFTVQQSELPCWVISAVGAEEVELTAMTMGAAGRGRQSRALEIRLMAYARAAANVENTLDTMLEEVEGVLLKTAFSGLAHDILLSSVEMEFTEEDADQTFGLLTATFIFQYATRQGSPGTLI